MGEGEELANSNIEVLADLLAENIKPSSRVLLFANNPAVPDEVFQTLDPQPDDIVLLFNIPLHRKWAEKSKKIIIFQNNHLGLAWGFQKDGFPTQEVIEVFRGKVEPIAGVFSGHLPEKISTHLPENLKIYDLPSRHFIKYYPNRGVSKTPSIGFFGYMLAKEIIRRKEIENPIYLIGFSGKSESIGSIVSHDWIYEQHIIRNDNEVCKAFCEGIRFPAVPNMNASTARKESEEAFLPIPAIQLTDEQLTSFVDRCKSREDVIRFVRKGGVGVELGVAEGEFSERVLRMNHLDYLYGVDMYAGDRGHDNKQYARTLRRLERFRNSHSLIKMTFDEALEVFRDGSLDFVYVDGYAHTGEDDGRHFDTWWEKISVGGIIAGDDYSDAWPQVIKSVNEFIRRKSLHMHLINCVEPNSTWSRNPTWFVVKR